MIWVNLGSNQHLLTKKILDDIDQLSWTATISSTYNQHQPTNLLLHVEILRKMLSSNTSSIRISTSISMVRRLDMIVTGIKHHWNPKWLGNSNLHSHAGIGALSRQRPWVFRWRWWHVSLPHSTTHVATYPYGANRLGHETCDWLPHAFLV